MLHSVVIARLWAVVVCSIALIGCQTTPEPKTADIPDWLNSPPTDKSYFYAVGVSGQTRYVKDAWNQAIQRARAEIGKTVVTEVSSRDLVVSTENSDFSRQIIAAMSDTELHFTEVVERWYDAHGAYGPPNHYYVLVRMERKEAEKLLKTLK